MINIKYNKNTIIKGGGFRGNLGSPEREGFQGNRRFPDLSLEYNKKIEIKNRFLNTVEQNDIINGNIIF
jgi:hypothetical protein